MIKKIVLALLFLSQLANAEDRKYPVSDIPEDLKKGMYGVIREQETRFEIISPGKSIYYYHYAITILSERGSDIASEVVGYTKDIKINTFKGAAYDAAGNLIKKLKQNEIHDRSAISGYSLYEESRMKSADLSQSVYPYTVEFEVEIQFNFLYSIPEFFLYKDDEISFQKNSYSLVFPKQYEPRVKMTGVKAPEKIEKDGKQWWTWNFENFVPSKFESYSPESFKIIPNIMAGPTTFDYGGYQGNMSTWSDYGKWIATLLKDRGELPEGTKQKVKELTNGLSSREEKAKVLYEYLQSKTRYVNISLGIIGGLQPIDAKAVDQNGYGDCKALSNYMVAMLKEAGIKAYYCTIRGGDDEQQVVADFPDHQANHIVVAVPNDKDTLWLECTSQTNPFGYQGRFTGDRKALMVTENGGYLVNTTKYPAEMNTQFRTAEITVGLNGDASAKVTTIYSGTQYENGGLDSYLNKSREEQKKWVQENTEIPGFDIVSFSMENKKYRNPVAKVKIELALKRYASVSGKRLFLTPNLMNRSTNMPPKNEARKNPILRKNPYIDVDTLHFTIPEEIYPEFIPKPQKISSRFGEYECSFSQDQGKLIYIRRVKMNKGEYPADAYNELMEFYKSINKADNIKVVFLNKT